MPLMIVSEEDWSREVNNFIRQESERIDNTGVVKDIEVGRGKGNKEVPEEVKKVLAETAIVEGRLAAQELAKNLGINEQMPHAYQNGSTSLAAYNKPDVGLTKHIDGVKDRISRKAKRVLLKSLDSITEDKLSEVKVTDAALVARAMSAIVKEMEPEKKNDNGNQNGPQFLIYAPQFKTEDHYETIVSKEG